MNAIEALNKDINSGDAVVMGRGTCIDGNWNVCFRYKGLLFACRFKNFEVERCETQPCDGFTSLQPFVDDYNHHMVFIQRDDPESELMDYITVSYIEPKDVRAWMKRSVDSDPSFWWVGGRARPDTVLTNVLTSNLLTRESTKYYSREIYGTPVLLTECPLKGNVYTVKPNVSISAFDMSSDQRPC